MSNRVGSQRSPFGAALVKIRAPLLAVGALSFFVNVLIFVGPLYSLQVFDRVLTSRSVETLVMLSIIGTGLLVASALIDHFRSHALVHIATLFDREMSGPVFTAIMQAARVEKGSRCTQFMRDIEAVRDFVGGGAVVAMFDAPWAPIFLAVCFGLHWQLGALALVGMIALVCLSIANDRLTRGPLVDASINSIASLDRLGTSLRNAEAIRGLGMTEQIRARWEDQHAEALGQTLIAGERGSAMVASSRFLRLFLQSAVLGLGAWLALRQEISPGVMFAASLIMGRALAPVDTALAQWKSFVVARGAAQRLERLLASFPAEPDHMSFPKPAAELSVEQIAVLAPGTRTPLIRDVSFRIGPGEAVAIVGNSGSGKSTLARALVGAWPIAGGTVRLDGYDIAHFDPSELGRSVGYLPQDVELFPGSVRDNIARFRQDVADAEVIEAARIAGAHELIQRLRQGYATELGEDGTGLSGGQRQRLGLARAIFGEPALVVLDEPNANLDAEGDNALLEAVSEMKERGSAVVVISHKTNLLMACDWIGLMHDGMLVKFGRREEMIPHVVKAAPAPAHAAIPGPVRVPAAPARREPDTRFPRETEAAHGDAAAEAGHPFAATYRRIAAGVKGS